MSSTTRLVYDGSKDPLVGLQRKLRHDRESLRNAILDGLDDMRSDGLMGRATLRPAGHAYSSSPPPKHVLLVCPACGVGVAESAVRDGWTERLECPKCHRWIPRETHLPPRPFTLPEGFL